MIHLKKIYPSLFQILTKNVPNNRPTTLAHQTQTPKRPPIRTNIPPTNIIFHAKPRQPTLNRTIHRTRPLRLSKPARIHRSFSFRVNQKFTIKSLQLPFIEHHLASQIPKNHHPKFSGNRLFQKLL